MRLRTIRQSITVRAQPHEVYETLMDATLHSQLIACDATISREVGGSFCIQDAGISGANIELVPDKKIVQTWRSEGEGWPANHYSRVTFVLKPVPDGTEIVFTQTGVPAQHYESVSRAWNIYYWQALKALLERKG